MLLVRTREKEFHQLLEIHLGGEGSATVCDGVFQETVNLYPLFYSGLRGFFNGGQVTFFTGLKRARPLLPISAQGCFG